MTAAEHFMELIKTGRINEARKMLEQEKEKAEFAPDAVTHRKDGTVTFTRKGKEVVCDSEGKWHPKK